ncbi:MAG: glycolate oxidase subunit GlcE [Gammaproteobacteria bacterium]|nr:glycolate oxidase subunit GlcE [Gammaproteobacteria bacterium]
MGLNINEDISQSLQERVSAAMNSKTALKIVGGNSKAFYGRETDGEILNVSGHSGILNYEPTELVATVRAGTKLSELQQALSAQGQMLPFEPPHLGESATVGGTVATNLSGPRRPFGGAVRDHVLGVKIINGKGEILHFGGEVMKNVAGYDLSRLMAGAMGTLGVLLEVSFKVNPVAENELTLYRNCSIDTAITTMNEWASRPYPISGGVFDGENLYIRFSGSENAVEAARKKFGGDELEDANNFWLRIKEQQHAFFGGDAPLWRLSLAPASPHILLPGKTLVDWAGAQRWYKGEANADDIRQAAQKSGGHAVMFRGGDRDQAFQPLDPVVMRLHKNLKQAMDPNGILNPGRLYAQL